MPCTYPRWTRFALSAAALLGCPAGALGQFEVGRTTIDFVDASRNDRVVSTRIRYPADTEGQDVPPAAGQHPVVAWGHGFSVLVGNYAPLWEAMVPAGYVVALPRFGNDPQELGRDLAFVITALRAEAQDSTSLFFGAIAASASAIGGHSMGGGAATLGASENPWIDTVVSLAALETAPSAIAAAASVEMPSLVLGGTADCVTPIATHQRPIYEALAAPCKYLVELTDGTHCGFLNPGNCDGFEGGCPTDSLQRARQLAQTTSLLVPWLDAHVGLDAAALAAFQNVLATDTLLTWEGSCNVVTAPPEVPAGPATIGLTAAPNPSAAGFRVHWAPGATIRRLRVQDVRGRLVRELEAGPSGTVWDGRSAAGKPLPGGVYWIRAERADGSGEALRVILLH